MGVDDMPYIIGLGMEVILDLHREYQAVIERYHAGESTVPIKAFFGDLVSRPVRIKAYPITLINQNTNQPCLKILWPPKLLNMLKRRQYRF